MPPKAKITREMIIDATFEIIRNTGVETVNARTISKKLNCSTQPVMYHFKTIDELKRAVYEKSDEYHSAYIMDIHSNNPMELQPIIAILSQETAVNAEQAKIIFRSLFLIAHGYASMFANNEMEYDEQTVLSDLGLIFDGAVKALRGGF